MLETTTIKSVDPGSVTISIVPVLPLQEVRRLAFTARQHAGRPSRHGSGGGGGGPSCPFFPKGVTASYRSTIIHGSTTRRASRPDILLFNQFILHKYIFMMLFDDLFVLE